LPLKKVGFVNTESSNKASRRFPDLVRIKATNAPFSTPEPGLMRRILAHNDSMMLVEHHMDAGWVGTRHAHPHDQLVYVIRGRLIFSCDNEQFEVVAGDSCIVRGGLDHGARALEPSVVLDVFTPYREDYV
jgi:quercetin dioxygenase-like cupin family protein